MATLKVHYNIEDGSFPGIIGRIIQHLTPAEGRRAPITEAVLEETVKEMKNLQENPNSLKGIYIPWDSAHHYAVELGIFPDLSSKARDILREERYSIPVLPGSRTDYRVLFFGKNVNCGDYPLTIRLDADSRGHSDGLELTQSWKKVFEEGGKQDMLDGIIDAGRKHGADSPEYSDILAGMPTTDRGFDERESNLRNRIASVMFKFYAGMMRFYEDFFGQPLRKEGFSPIKVECLGPVSADLDIPLEVFSEITKHPQVPLKDILDKWIGTVESRNC